MAAQCVSQHAFPVQVAGLRSVGRGVAFGLSSPALTQLRRTLAETWSAWLTPQDRQGYRPHITIQNKADPAEARALLQRLQADFVPYAVQAHGLLLWWYRGGPWEAAGQYPFQPQSSDAGAPASTPPSITTV